jgi:hypothetical protein
MVALSTQVPNNNFQQFGIDLGAHISECGAISIGAALTLFHPAPHHIRQSPAVREMASVA